MKTITFYVFSIFILLSSLSATVYANSWLQQRWQFKEAHHALSQNDLENFTRLAADLQKDYPISHYLHYLRIKSNLSEENNATIQAFIKQNKASPIAQILQRAWLAKLAKQQDWEAFLVAYTPQKSTVLRCHYLQARLKIEEQLANSLIKEAKDLWVVGESQPKACDPAFKYLYKQKLITNKLRWQRTRLAMQNGNMGLARYLAKGLPKVDRKLVALWQSMHNNPASALKKFKHPNTSIAQEILLYGIRRLARKNASSAHKHLENYRKKYSFKRSASAELFRYIALQAARQNRPEAALWLGKVQNNLINDRVTQTRLQIVLAQQDWQAMLKLVQSLPTDLQKKSKFQYWRARALEQTMQTDIAEKLLQGIFQDRDYYSFLASDRIGKPYYIHSKPLKITKRQKNKLLNKYAGLVRARELYNVGLPTMARREWYAVLPTLTNTELKIAASLAFQWGWHDRAIATVAQAKDYGDLELRFPLPFYDNVISFAQANQLDFAYVYAVMRQESLFQIDAKSPVGALGLMQLMPATAKKVAKRQNIRIKSIYDILTPSTNIELGTSYLRQMLDRFDGNHLLATAAYNAGPSRAKQWAKRYSCLPADVWIELIPFTETRKYVQRVLSYTPIFEARMVGHKQIKPMLLDTIEADGCSDE